MYEETLEILKIRIKQLKEEVKWQVKKSKGIRQSAESWDNIAKDNVEKLFKLGEEYAELRKHR